MRQARSGGTSGAESAGINPTEPHDLYFKVDEAFLLGRHRKPGGDQQRFVMTGATTQFPPPGPRKNNRDGVHRHGNTRNIASIRQV